MSSLRLAVILGICLITAGSGRADEASATAALTKIGAKVIQGGAAIDFRKSKVTDESLKDVLAFKDKLHTIHLGSTAVTDEGMKIIGALPGMVELRLTDTAITDAGVKELRGLKRMSRFSLTYCKITDEAMKDVGQLKGLTELRLGSTGITDAGLKELKDLKNLDELSVTNTKVTNAGLKHLTGLKNLDVLHLDGTQCDEVGLREFRDHKHLGFIGFVDTNVGDALLREVKTGYPNLRSLDVTRTRVTQAGIKELQAARQVNIFTSTPK
jgi:hypothetical protein